MNSQSAPYRSWRATAVVGGLLAAIPIGLGCIDLATHFRFDFISDYFDYVLMLIPVGLVICFVGCIGWAKHLGRSGRSALASGVFVSAWAVVLLGYLTDGMNVHGTAGLVMMLLLPLMVLVIVLAIMAGFARKASGSSRS